jgi:hypothetical protein
MLVHDIKARHSSRENCYRGLFCHMSRHRKHCHQMTHHRMPSDVTKFEGALGFPLWFRRWSATDPRDKLFAIRGLIEKATYPMCVEVDYSKSVSKIYHEFAISTISMMQTLDILQPLAVTQELLRGFHRGYLTGAKLGVWLSLDSYPLAFMRPRTPNIMPGSSPGRLS